MLVGSGGDGQLTVSGGGQLHYRPFSLIGVRSGRERNAYHHRRRLDAHARIRRGTAFTVGWSGIGTLIITNGGTANLPGLSIAQNGTSQGTLFMSDAGSTMSVGALDIGLGGQATMDLKNGATITTTGDFRVGVGANSISGATVEGDRRDADRRRIHRARTDGHRHAHRAKRRKHHRDHRRTLGRRSRDRHRFRRGRRTLNTRSTIVAKSGSASGHVTVSGVGPHWTNSQTLSVGGQELVPGGVGVLDISSGGAVDVGGVLIVGNTVGSAVNICAAEPSTSPATRASSRAARSTSRHRRKAQRQHPRAQREPHPRQRRRCSMT